MRRSITGCDGIPDTPILMGWDRLWEAHLLVDVGLPRLFGLEDVVWFGVLAAGGLVLSFAVAAPSSQPSTDS